VNWKELISTFDSSTLIITSLSPAHLIKCENPKAKLQIVDFAGPKILSLENLNRQLKIAKANGDFNEIFAIGGGTVSEVAKFISHETLTELNQMPSVLSTDSPFCTSIAIRNFDHIDYRFLVEPKRICFDEDLLRLAPMYLNQLGLCDILSIITASNDWYIRELKRRGTLKCYDTDFVKKKKLIELARIIPEEIRLEMSSLREITPKSISIMINAFLREVYICDVFGNASPEEGAEHYFAYTLEFIGGIREVPHGILVLIGIYYILRIQEFMEYVDPERMIDSDSFIFFLRMIGLLGRLQIFVRENREIVENCLYELKNYAKRYDTFLNFIKEDSYKAIIKQILKDSEL